VNSYKRRDDYIVVGAGYAGVTAAAYLARAGKRVSIVEAHSTPGGCAGYFRKGGFSFDVGATTLNGFEHGLPLSRLIGDLGLQSRFKKMDPAVSIHMQGHVYRRYADTERWIEELFPLVSDKDELRTFLKRIQKESDEFWAVATRYPLSPYGVEDYFAYSKMGPFRLWRLVESFYRSLFSQIPRSLRKSSGFLKLLNELLLISAQGYAETIPSAVGALGLGYMADMYYPIGGISRLAEEMCQVVRDAGGQVSFNDPVKSVRIERGGYEVLSRKESRRTQEVIFAIPIWNIPALFDEPRTADKIQKTASRHRNCWSAVTANIGLRFSEPVDGLYHQIHIQDTPREFHSGSIFVSLSDPDDVERAPVGYRSVTVSSHARWSDFPDGRTTADYLDRKERLGAYIISKLKDHFAFSDSNIDQFHLGTPKTFERFTRRYNGWVGGIPWKAGSLPLFRPRYRLPGKGLYLIGDTALPGQGVSGVVLGAQSLVNKLLR
jgi:phytoene dehydrogenase-like protein